MEGYSKIAIVGGGLVGSLCACYFGKRGYDVDLYEYREDIRECELVHGRSINLALSIRGQEALKGVNLEKTMVEYGIPMYGRMVHDIHGRTRSIPYDPVFNRCIYSVGRKYLNEILLTEAEKDSNVHFHFEHKLMNIKFSEGKMIFRRPNGALVEKEADLIIGADGAFSAVRSQLVKREMVNYTQTYVKHGYMELCIPPENNHMMAANHLHIWPRGGFMMIALPNQDKSWTVTLFMPHQEFARLDNEKAVLHFFKFYFPDAVDIIGQDFLLSTFLSNKPSFLLTVKCSPYHVDGKAVIIGDAAHAMVPFFGQGMNAGFEDVRLLDDILHNHGYSVGDALRIFSMTRNPNAEAICDLAMYNYIEMRDLVNRPSFLFRKYLDNLLYKIVPSFWMLRFIFYCLLFIVVCTIFLGTRSIYFSGTIKDSPFHGEL
uniref:Kynurenine 3-monooxygenase n=2 Tax=Rhodnius TaxID=13248 RepID=T1HCF0_RHOPR